MSRLLIERIRPELRTATRNLLGRELDHMTGNEQIDLGNTALEFLYDAFGIAGRQPTMNSPEATCKPLDDNVMRVKQSDPEALNSVLEDAVATYEARKSPTRRQHVRPPPIREYEQELQPMTAGGFVP